MDYAANLAIFLMEETGSVLSTWTGKLPANEQRKPQLRESYCLVD